MDPHRFLVPALLLALALPHAPARAAIPDCAQVAAGDTVVPCVCGGSSLPIGVVSPPGGFLVGCAHPYVIRAGAGSGRRGTYDLLELPPCPGDPCGGSGASLLRCRLVAGYACCLDSLDLVPVVTGVKAGPVAQALRERWSRDTDRREGICHADYAGNGSRIVWLAVLGSGPGAPGRERAYRGAAAFFLTRVPAPASDDLIGEFVAGLAR